MLQHKNHAAFNVAVILSLLLTCKASALEVSDRFYVDFSAGSDDAKGTTPEQAWRHAPGDPNATGRPANHVLQPGDTVLFRGGVAYRGSFVVTHSGETGRPISYLGEGFGEGKAILDGKERTQVLVQPCGQDKTCAALPNADALSVIDLPSPIAPSDQVVLGGRRLHLAQAPVQSEPFWFDDLAHYQKVERDQLTSGTDGMSWRLVSSYVKEALAAAPIHDLLIHIWRMPNAITSVKATEYDPNTSTLGFKARNLMPYPNKPTQFALANHPGLIKQPDQFATIAAGSRLVIQGQHPQTVAIEISRRKNAIQINDQKHIVISGFEITGYAARSDEFNNGTALRINPKGATDIAFSNNYVHDLGSWAGASAVTANKVSGFQVSNNIFLRINRGGGIAIGGNSADVYIRSNSFDHIGRTGIAILGAERVSIEGNRLTQIKSVHGNGIAIYRDNRDVIVSNNFVDGTPRALTFQGGPASDKLAIRHNVLVGSGRDGSAIQSWGKKARGVTIEGNVLAVVDGGRSAVRLNGGDQAVQVKNNLIDGLLIAGALSPGWAIAGNVYTKENIGGRKAAAAQFDGDNTFSGSFEKSRTAILRREPALDPRLCALLAAPPPSAASWIPPSSASTTPAPIVQSVCAP